MHRRWQLALCAVALLNLLLATAGVYYWRTAQAPTGIADTRTRSASPAPGAASAQGHALGFQAQAVRADSVPQHEQRERESIDHEEGQQQHQQPIQPEEDASFQQKQEERLQALLDQQQQEQLQQQQQEQQLKQPQLLQQQLQLEQDSRQQQLQLEQDDRQQQLQLEQDNRQQQEQRQQQELQLLQNQEQQQDRQQQLQPDQHQQEQQLQQEQRHEQRPQDPAVLPPNPQRRDGPPEKEQDQLPAPPPVAQDMELAPDSSAAATTPPPLPQVAHANPLDDVKAAIRDVKSLVAWAEQQVLAQRPQPSLSTLDINNVQELKLRAAQINAAETIHNLHLNPQLLQDPDLVVFFLMCHNRADYMRILFSSMRDLRDKDKALLVISQDLFRPEIEELISSIDFMPYMRLAFPYALQLYPGVFPGEHPNDCPRDMAKQQALAAKCNNAPYPDKYQHYREAPMVTVKHHWWWKLNHIFDHVNILKNHTGFKLLLEDDYYLSPDTIFVLRKMRELVRARGLEQHIVIVGDYKPNALKYTGEVLYEGFVVGDHNIGMVFTRAHFEKLKECSREFCLHDDLHWDWSYARTMSTCLSGKGIRIVRLSGGRVFHFGVCGQHARSNDCSVDRVLDPIKGLLQSVNEQLFPAELQLRSSTNKVAKITPWGGWGDIRDRYLCLHFVGHNLDTVGNIAG